MKVYGKRAVVNLGHSEAEMEAVTQTQKQEIFPYLRRCLRGSEKVLLDLGCGPGRFTGALASMIDGKAIGLDPITALLEMAPKAENIEYRVMKEGEIPLGDNYADVVWICLVLGGLNGNLVNETIAEINRVLKKNGLVFLVENTSKKKDSEHWCFRSIEEYKRMFSFCRLEHLHSYCDLSERISIMAGRRIEMVNEGTGSNQYFDPTPI